MTVDATILKASKAAKVMSAEEAIGLIPDGATVAVSGFITACLPDFLSATIESSFEQNQHPRDLTLVYTGGIGDGAGRGAAHFAHAGLLKRVIGGHFGFSPDMQRLINDGSIEAYNLPQGVTAQIIRDTAAGRPGTLSRVGLGTFVDPRRGGGKMNQRTTDELVRLMSLADKEWLFYSPIPVTVAVIRATYADSKGNLSVDHLPVHSSIENMARAAHNAGGLVIAQVDAVVEDGTLDARLVKIPGYMVDAIVVPPADERFMTVVDAYQPAYCGEVRVPLDSIDPLPLDVRKVIARRAYLELGVNEVVNIGFGIPEGVAKVAAEEGTADELNLTLESGVNGGVAESDVRFGVSWNPDLILDECAQFDFYGGGGLDATFIGLAQMDQHGNVNVSRFGPRIAGCGGAIDVTQTAKRVVFCGTFTAKGLKAAVGDGQVTILAEGAQRKLLADVEQITFSGEYAHKEGQRVTYITERAVFELTSDGLVLTEIAPGIDLQRDIIEQMDFTPRLSPDLRRMDARIFRDAPMRQPDEAPSAC